MNRDEPAFPKLIQEGHSGEYVYAFDGGMTKREYAAVQIMAGFAADPEAVFENGVGVVTVKNIARAALEWTDALFDELEKEGTR
jgi:hypothetical protein